MLLDSLLKGNANTTKLINDLKKQADQFPILSKQQEQDLINKYKDDRDTLNYYLFMHNIRSVFNQAKTFIGSNIDFDTLVQEGMLGLAEACKRFDTTKNVKFITYAIPWIRKMILQHFYNKNNELNDKTISLDSPTLTHSSKDDGGNDATFENFIDDYVDPSQQSQKTINEQISANEQIEICKKLYEFIENDTTLSSLDKEIFTDAFYNKEKTRDIAEKYNIEMSLVNEVKHKILAKLKNFIKDTMGIHSYYDIYSA